MSYNITINAPEITIPRAIKFPEKYCESNKNKNIVTITPSQNPSCPEYSFQLLEAELQLDVGENITQKLVTKLFQLYRVGIEYYNQKKSKKQFYFQKKIQSLTNNPLVLGALHQSDTGTDTFYKKKQIQKLVEIDQRKSAPAQILKSMFQNELTVSTHLKTQSDLIQKRLNQRKMLKKSFQEDRDNNIEQIPVPARKKLNRTVIISSSNPEDDQSKYFVDGATFSRDV